MAMVKRERALPSKAQDGARGSKWQRWAQPGTALLPIPRAADMALVQQNDLARTPVLPLRETRATAAPRLAAA